MQMAFRLFWFTVTNENTHLKCWCKWGQNTDYTLRFAIQRESYQKFQLCGKVAARLCWSLPFKLYTQTDEWHTLLTTDYNIKTAARLPPCLFMLVYNYYAGFNKVKLWCCGGPGSLPGSAAPAEHWALSRWTRPGLSPPPKHGETLHGLCFSEPY